MQTMRKYKWMLAEVKYSEYYLKIFFNSSFSFMKNNNCFTIFLCPNYCNKESSSPAIDSKG